MSVMESPKKTTRFSPAAGGWSATLASRYRANCPKSSVKIAMRDARYWSRPGKPVGGMDGGATCWAKPESARNKIERTCVMRQRGLGCMVVRFQDQSSIFLANQGNLCASASALKKQIPLLRKSSGSFTFQSA